MTCRATVVVLLGIALPALTAAQDVRQAGKTIAFPNFTVEQNWARATTLSYSQAVGGFAIAKRSGMTAEAYGRAVGEIFEPGWGQPDAGSAIRFARGIQNNLRAASGVSVDVASVNDTLITMRVNRSWRSYFGPTETNYGVTLAEYDAINGAVIAEIARYLGLRYSQRVDSAYVTMTISGRGKNAVLDFPRGVAYKATITAQDLPNRPDRVGDWEITYTPDGHFNTRKDGAAYVHGDYQVYLDEIVLSNERNAAGAVTCSETGRYRWTVNPTTRALSFGLLSDPCEPRAVVVTRKAFTSR